MATHSRTAPKPRAVIGTPWAIRKAVYALTLIAGILAVTFGLVDQATADTWTTYAGQISSALVGLLAVVGGGLATVNTGPESDDKPVGVPVATLPTQPAPTDVFSTYHPIEE